VILFAVYFSSYSRCPTCNLPCHLTSTSSKDTCILLEW